MESKKPESTTSHVDSAPRLRPAASATYSAYLYTRRAVSGARCGPSACRGRTHGMWNFVEMTPSAALHVPDRDAVALLRAEEPDAVLVALDVVAGDQLEQRRLARAVGARHHRHFSPCRTVHDSRSKITRAGRYDTVTPRLDERLAARRARHRRHRAADGGVHRLRGGASVARGRQVGLRLEEGGDAPLHLRPRRCLPAGAVGALAERQAVRRRERGGRCAMRRQRRRRRRVAVVRRARSARSVSREAASSPSKASSKTRSCRQGFQQRADEHQLAPSSVDIPRPKGAWRSGAIPNAPSIRPTGRSSPPPRARRAAGCRSACRTAAAACLAACAAAGARQSPRPCAPDSRDRRGRGAGRGRRRRRAHVPRLEAAARLVASSCSSCWCDSKEITRTAPRRTRRIPDFQRDRRRRRGRRGRPTARAPARG